MRKDLYNDGIGFVESFDFSKANTSQESRIKAVTTVASICYNAPKIIDSIDIYDKLGAESLGLPSSSYEFVPVLIDKDDYDTMWSDVDDMNFSYEMFTFDMEKYGQWIEGESEVFLLTNLRAVLNDQKKYIVIKNTIDFKTYFNNSPEEIQIIKDNFKVFYKKVPIFIARQLVRHRVSFQELSRRYTDDKKAPIEFYVKKDVNKKENTWGPGDAIKECTQYCLDTYNFLIEEGEKAEDARAVLPAAIYTNIWSAWLPDAYDNFIKLRTKKTAQSEIIELANAMEGLK